MPNNTLELISGAYTNTLWEALEDVLTNEDSPAHIYDVLKALRDCGKDKTAFAFVRTLYDITGFALPDVVEELDESDETRNRLQLQHRHNHPRQANRHRQLLTSTTGFNSQKITESPSD